jgi:hypothetical protein
MKAVYSSEGSESTYEVVAWSHIPDDHSLTDSVSEISLTRSHTLDEVLKTVTVKITVFRDVRLRAVVTRYRCS